MKNKIEYPIRTFEHEQFGTLRALMLDGEPWFVSRDAMKCLGYQATTNAIYKYVPAKEKTIVALDIGHGMNRVSVITACGLLRLADRSFMPGAKKFAGWVRTEVLPALRETGIREPATHEEEVKAWEKALDKMRKPRQPAAEEPAAQDSPVTEDQPAGKTPAETTPADGGDGFCAGLLIIIVEEG